MAQVIECLPSKFKALRSNAIKTQLKKKKKKKHEQPQDSGGRRLSGNRVRLGMREDCGESIGIFM
jgi:hypothetical protein